MATNYAAFKTGKELLFAGVKPKTAKEKLRLILTRRIESLRDQHGVSEQLFSELYPNTVAPMNTAIQYTRALVAGLDVLVFGPPGSGKTTFVNDTIALFPAQAYVVDGCELQCNPFSLFDSEFSSHVKPCPSCKQKHGGTEYLTSGIFNPTKIKPEDVPVRLTSFRDGFGISRFRGSPDTFPEDLSGKIDLVQYEKFGDPFDHRVFRAGKLSHGNNGIVNINEVGKIPVKAQDALLDALSESEVKPSGTREAVPSSAVVLCDTNTPDLDRISGPLNDRLMAIFFPYPATVEANYTILKRNMYGEKPKTTAPSLDDILTTAAPSLLDIPVSVPLEKAMCSLMIEYRGHTLCARFEETGSNRALLDADKLSRANAIIYGEKNVSQNDAIEAMTQAILGNIHPRTTKDYLEHEKSVRDYVSKNLPIKFEEECKAYWCEFAKLNDATTFVQIAKETRAIATEVRSLYEENNKKKNDAKTLGNKGDKAGAETLLVEAKEVVQNYWGLCHAVVDGAKAQKFWEYVKSTTPIMPVSDDNKAALAGNILRSIQAYINVPRTA